MSSVARGGHCPLGARLTVEQLGTDPYQVLADMQQAEPVSWVPCLDAWLVTGRELGIAVMRDTGRFTVDDPRFSTAVVLGQSMLSLEGEEHERHRSAFLGHFRPSIVRDRFEPWLRDEATRLVDVAARRADVIEFRSAVAGPLAVNTIATFLGLPDVDTGDILAWYESISRAIVDVSLGQPISGSASRAVDDLGQCVRRAFTDSSSALLGAIREAGQLSDDELVVEAGIVMFGAIETSEAMTANALWHLLTNPEVFDQLRADRRLLPAVVEESLRLEPAAAVVDRYATVDVVLDGITIEAGDLVTVSLLAANRDPSVFEAPDQFQVGRPNVQRHVTFVQGPHRCIGLHLARLETIAALDAVLELGPEIRLDADRSSPPAGLIFRKPDAVFVRL